MTKEEYQKKIDEIKNQKDALDAQIEQVQKEHGDIEVLDLENTYGEGEWVSLEDSGVNFDRFNEGKNIVYIGW